MQEQSVVTNVHSGNKPPSGDRNGLATASLVLGIVSFFLFFFTLIPWIGVVIWIVHVLSAILAFIFGILGLKSERRGSAITGIVFSSIVIGLYLIFILFAMTLGAAIFTSLF